MGGDEKVKKTSRELHEVFRFAGNSASFSRYSEASATIVFVTTPSRPILLVAVNSKL